MSVPEPGQFRPPVETTSAATSSRIPSGEWRRLDRRMIAVDAVQAFVSLIPVVVLDVVVGVQDEGPGRWPLVAVAIGGVFSAAVDAYRWVVTRYRVTDDLVELRTGVLVRQERSVRRERIRSVDVHAKLRHRLGGLRIVSIGAGQQSSTGEAAFDLDAVSIADARALQRILVERRSVAEPGTSTSTELDGASAPSVGEPPVASGPDEIPLADLPDEDVEVIARLDPRWVVFNMVGSWSYLMAAGVIWGGYWMLSSIGVELDRIVGRAVDWDALGTFWTIVVALVAVTVVGALGMAVNFFLEHGRFVLARVPTDAHGTALRTSQGLLTTREVTRDDTRLRGAQISEPTLWRWMGMADTSVVTTGLSMWALSQPAAILPRGPISVARRVAAVILDGGPSPFDAPMRSHPFAALRRRVVWSLTLSMAAVASTGGLALAGALPWWPLLVALGCTPLVVGAAWVAYRSLGHTISGPYLVVRSGLVNRATTALQRSAVSTVTISESVLQRRLGLRTFTAMTSAGDGAYAAIDVGSEAAMDVALSVAPELLAPFLEQVEVSCLRPLQHERSVLRIGGGRGT